MYVQPPRPTPVLTETGRHGSDAEVVGEYRLLDGTVIANNLADLTDGTLDHPIDMDEYENGPWAAFVWTGTIADGTSQVGSCDVWTTNSDQIRGRIGSSAAMDQTWSDVGEGDPNVGGQPCDTLNRLYCFSDYEVPVELEEFSVE
jgi:hypothetical protein